MATATILLPVLAASGDVTDPPGLGFSTNGRPYLIFDASTDWLCMWTFRTPADYASALTLKYQYTMATATTGNIVVQCEVMAAADNVDVQTDSYDTANSSGAVAVPGTAGLIDDQSLTLTNADSVAAGSHCVIRFRRDADNVSDTATGNMRLWAASLEYTTT